VPDRVPAMPARDAHAEPVAAVALPVRNRRTAIGLVVWIVGLMLVSALVAWFRN
jgi:hypothetical protein